MRNGDARTLRYPVLISLPFQLIGRAISRRHAIIFIFDFNNGPRAISAEEGGATNQRRVVAVLVVSAGANQEIDTQYVNRDTVNH